MSSSDSADVPTKSSNYHITVLPTEPVDTPRPKSNYQKAVDMLTERDSIPSDELDCEMLLVLLNRVWMTQMTFMSQQNLPDPAELLYIPEPEPELELTPPPKPKPKAKNKSVKSGNSYHHNKFNRSPRHRRYASNACYGQCGSGYPRGR